MDAQEVVERIMTAHWGSHDCPCWVCTAGRALGFNARKSYIYSVGDTIEFPVPCPELFIPVDPQLLPRKVAGYKSKSQGY
jgi:hypothetical protein